MRSQLKALIITNLHKIPEFLTESLIFIPSPKIINRLEENNVYILNSECILAHFNVEKPKLLINDINEFLRQNSSIKLKEGEIKDSDRLIIQQKTEWDLLDINNDEAYNLEIFNNQICVYSNFEKGLFYGVQTLVQLMKNSLLSNKKLIKAPINERNQLYLPEIEIKDLPDLRIRGVTIDVSRGQVFTIEGARRFLKILSHYKLNFCFFYMEDVFLHPKHPKIGKNRGGLTIGQIKEIDRYSKEHFIELVPIFECLGHVDNILMHDDYRPLGEFPGGHCFDLSNPEIYVFIEDFISEISKCFSSEYFHIGCDEAYDIGTVRSKDYIENKKIKNVIVEFSEKIYNITKKHDNRNIILYHDLLKHDNDLINVLNKNFILMYSNYAPKEKYSKIKNLLNAGYRLIVNPSMLNWNRHFPDNKNSSKNVINLAKEAYKYKDKGCLGLVSSSWGEQWYYSFRETELFGLILTGAVSWTFLNFDYSDFISRYGYIFFGINKKYLSKFHQMFTLLSSSASSYYKDSTFISPSFYSHLFRHPFPFEKFSTSIRNYKKLYNIANQSLELYDELKSKVIFEPQNFKYIQFNAELAHYLAEKLDLSQEVSDSLQKLGVVKEIHELIIPKLQEFIIKTEYMKMRYEKLWYKAVKRPSLPKILKLFDFLINCYKQKIEQIKTNVHFTDPFLMSEWIWINDPEESTSPIFFRKTIEILEPINNAVIQCIAGNYMKIYLNNEFLGDVYSRFSLSPLPIELRVKTFDITKLLKEGENVLAIEAWNFEGEKGGINIYGQNKLKYNRIQHITSDNWWVCSRNSQETDEWRSLNYDDSDWEPVKSYGRPPNFNGDIYKPNLLEGDISNTQDNFGIENWINVLTKKKIFRHIKLLK